jgi:hypothetical protein
MSKFSGSHRSDALYQGTTLVGPLRPNKDLGLPDVFSIIDGTAEAVPFVQSVFRNL